MNNQNDKYTGEKAERPIISVVMATYNEEKYLPKTIESILCQTFEDFEFIIIDDGSTDRTGEILRHYANLDNRIIILSNPDNLKLAKSLNRGIKEAKGRYIARMDAGDISDSKRFEKQVNFLEQNPGIQLVGTWAYVIDEDGEIIKEWKKPLTITKSNILAAEASIHPTVMCTRQLFEKLGLYNPNCNISLEFDLCLRIIKEGLIIRNIPEFLVCCMRREHGMTLTNIKITQANRAKLKLRYLPEFFSLCNLAYTVRTVIGYLLPTVIMRYLNKKIFRI